MRSGTRSPDAKNGGAQPEPYYARLASPARCTCLLDDAQGGLSLAPYDSFNLAEHTGDDPAAVHANRNALYAALRIGVPPRWSEQQ